jgi:hypothetical protein
MKILLSINDSMGHLLPAIRFAQIAQRLGHGVVVVSAECHSALLDLYGIEHIPVTNSGTTFMATWDWYGVDTVASEVRVFDSVVERIRPDVVICGPLAISAMIFAERRKLPVGIIGYSTYLYPALNDDDTTRWWRLNSISGFYNAARTHLGLPEVSAHPDSTPLIGDAYLLRNVPEFTGPSSLPPQVMHVGGLHLDPGAGHGRARAFAQQWRSKGRRVVYVQMGRLFEKSEIWTTLMAALELLGMAAIADTGRSDYLHDESAIPPHCFVSRFVSLGDVADLVDAVICSGHGASLLGAMSQQKPLACLPTSADSKELADRVVACGLGVRLDPMQSPGPLAVALQGFFDQQKSGHFDGCLRQFHDALAVWIDKEEAVIDAMLMRLESIAVKRRTASVIDPCF